MRRVDEIAGWLIALLVAFSSCEKKFDLSTLPQQDTSTRDTSYIQIYPAFGGFTKPQDVLVGNDQLLYVADTYGGDGSGRVVMLNLAGGVLSSRAILHPISLAQDTRLDLLVGGELVAANGDTAGAIFRIHLVSTSPDSAHQLGVARVDTVWRELARPSRRFPGVTVLPDNSWLAARTGPDNSSFIDPDARVLLFSNRDVFITPVPAFATRAGSGITDINFPTGIASFPNVRDFVLIQSSEGVAYCALWMQYQNNPEFEGWLPRYDPAIPSARLVDFIRPNRYLKPEGVAIDRGSRDVFVADAALDSVFKFNSRGVLKPESFGRIESRGFMKHPVGLAVFSRILYVLDDSTSQVIRFTLTTDVPR